jgi:hypothetical protein
VRCAVIRALYTSTSVVDPYPDPDGIRIQWGPWIRIQKDKNDPQTKMSINLFYGHQNQDPEPDPDSLEMLDPQH